METKNIARSLAVLAFVLAATLPVPMVQAQSDTCSATCSPPCGGGVQLPVQAKQPGDYNVNVSVTAPPTSTPTTPYSGGKLGMITPVIANGLTYINLETGEVIPNPNQPPPPAEPLPEPGSEPPPPPKDHGRILAVGADSANPGGVIVIYQDGTVEHVSPPPKQSPDKSW